jgi:hypothetical protein
MTKKGEDWERGAEREGKEEERTNERRAVGQNWDASSRS